MLETFVSAPYDHAVTIFTHHSKQYFISRLISMQDIHYRVGRDLQIKGAHTEMTCPDQETDPPYSRALPGELVRGAMPPHTLGEAQRGSSVQLWSSLSKYHESSAGQGPPPLPPLYSIGTAIILIYDLKTIYVRSQ